MNPKTNSYYPFFLYKLSAHILSEEKYIRLFEVLRKSDTPVSVIAPIYYIM